MKQVKCYGCGKKSNIFTRFFYKRDIVIEHTLDKPKLVYNCPRCNKELEKAFNTAFKD